MRKDKGKQKNELVEEFPMRINKYLAHKNYATRRAADALIEKGVVFINGKRAMLGDRVTEKDTVEVKGKSNPKKYVYLAYNKTKGVVTSLPQHGDKDIKQLLIKQNIPDDIFPLGRLDKDSHGLIILTNDGRITDRLLNPKFEHEKEYEVRTQERLRESFERHMASGVDIGEKEKTKPCIVKRTGNNSFKIVLGEGKRHQIRRMVTALHNTVVDLKRTRIMNIKLGSLRAGAFRTLGGKELQDFLATLGIDK